MIFVLFCVGFLCPVHTPDGAPCGLLNHMAALCEVSVLKHIVGKLGNGKQAFHIMHYIVKCIEGIYHRVITFKHGYGRTVDGPEQCLCQTD